MRCGGLGFIQGDFPQPLPSKTHHKQCVIGDFDTAGACLSRGPLLQRINVLIVGTDALNFWPTVVTPGLDHIELVPGILPKLAGVHSVVVGPVQSLWIAVAVTVYR